MKKPLAICLERLPASPAGNEPVFTRCVALPEDHPGLGLTARGEITWEVASDDLVRLQVGREGGLVLCRPPGSPETELHRLGRARTLNETDQIDVLQGDVVVVGDGTAFRVHLHGVAPAVAAPEPLVVEPARQPSRSSKWTQVAAAAVIGAAGVMGASGCDDGCERIIDIPVRESPPSEVSMPPDAPPPQTPPEPPEPPKPPDQVEVRPMTPAVRPPQGLPTTTPSEPGPPPTNAPPSSRSDGKR